MKGRETYIGIAAIVLLCLCLGFYFRSDNPSHWGSFGDYIGGVGSVVLSIAVFFYTYQVNKRVEEERQDEKRRQLLAVIEELLKKIKQHESRKSSEEGGQNGIGELDIEIRTLFARGVALARFNGIPNLPPKGKGVGGPKGVEEYVNKWLSHIENEIL